jgi:hypothetical protein
MWLRPFNVGCNEQNYQIAELGRMIKEMVPTARVVTQPKEDDRNYHVCFDKIRNMLNFEPRYTVRDGIQEIMDAFSTGQVKDYREPWCSNFAFLKQNAELRRLFVDGKEEWGWARLSAEDAAMLTEIAVAVFESRSMELKDRLYRGLVQALLGDVDGFLNTLAGIDLIPGRRIISALQDSSAKV